MTFYSFFVVISVFSASFHFTVQNWPSILDIILPKNESRLRHVQTMMEYFDDQNRYYFLLLLNMNTAFIIGATAMLATGSMLIAFLQHICGMFAISW